MAQQPPSALEFGGVSTYQKSAQSYEEDSSDSSEEDDYSTSSEDELDTLFDKLNIDDNKVEEVTIDGFNLKDVAKHREMIHAVLVEKPNRTTRKGKSKEQKEVDVNETKLYPTITAF